MDASLSDVVRERGFDVLFHAHPDGVYAYDRFGRFINCNGAMCALTGYSREELLTMTFAPLIVPEFLEVTMEMFNEAVAGRTVRYVADCRAKDGHSFMVDITKIPLRDGDGEVVGVLGIARDVSALSRLVEEVDASRAINRIAGRIARFAGWSIDAATGRLHWSEEMLEILGIDPREVPDYDTVIARIREEPQRREIDAMVRRCLDEGVAFNVQTTVRDGRGQNLVVRVMGESARNDVGSVLRVDGALYDVTSIERQRIEMEELEGRVARTLNELDTPLAFVDRSWRVTFANEAASRLTGLSVARLTAGTLWDAFPESVGRAFGELCRRAMEEGRFGTLTNFTESYENHFESTVFPTRDGIVITARNVTAQVETLRTIDEYTQRVTFLAQMLDLAEDAMIVRDFDQGIIYWNKSAEEIYGWTFEEVSGRTSRDLFYVDPSDGDKELAEVLSKGFWMGEVEHRTKEGGRVWVDVRRQLIRDAKGHPIGIFGVNTDVTATRLEKEARVRTQRMESLGTLAGGIAHDLNNVLAPIMMSIDLLERGELDERRRQLLDSMRASVRRGADMVRQVLSFARGVEGDRRALDIGTLLSELQHFCRDALPKNIDVDFDVVDGLWVVMGDSTQLTQVHINLVTNARDAMPDGGRLQVRAFNALSEVDGSSGSVRAVVIQVSDTGVGMDAEVAARIFEPFFTTKEFGVGTGLGLSTSMAIIKGHGGRINVSSEVGVGTRFDLILPAADSAARSLDAMTPPPAEPSVVGRRVLVVDDEEPIRIMLDQVLRAEGLSVETAANGVEALATLKEAPVPFDLVVSDLNMPQVGGERLAALAREMGVPTRFIFMSGIGASRSSSDGQERFIAKPFTTTELVDLVRDVVG